MKYITENITEIEKLAVSMMLFATCGEDENTMANAEVSKTSPNTFHIEYDVANPFNGISLTVEIRRESYANGQSSVFHYNVISSAYGDTGEFTLTIE
jgi:hypothetical protein